MPGPRRVLGVPIAVLAYGFLKLDRAGPAVGLHRPAARAGPRQAPPWWPLLPLAVAGLLTGLSIRFLPGHGGESPVAGSGRGRHRRARMLPGIFCAALASIGLGAVVGPEVPLIALGGGLAYLASPSPGATCPAGGRADQRHRELRRDQHPARHAAGRRVPPAGGVRRRRGAGHRGAPPGAAGLRRRRPDLHRPGLAHRLRHVLPGDPELAARRIARPRRVRVGDRDRSRRGAAVRRAASGRGGSRGRARATRFRRPFSSGWSSAAWRSATPRHRARGLRRAVLRSGPAAGPADRQQPLLRRRPPAAPAVQGARLHRGAAAFRGGPTFPAMFLGASAAASRCPICPG